MTFAPSSIRPSSKTTAPSPPACGSLAKNVGSLLPCIWTPSFAFDLLLFAHVVLSVILIQALLYLRRLLPTSIAGTAFYDKKQVSVSSKCAAAGKVVEDKQQYII